MNTYTTTCETRGCVEFIVQRAESFDAAIAGLRRAGWFARERDEHGYESHCPSHRPACNVGHLLESDGRCVPCETFARSTEPSKQNRYSNRLSEMTIGGTGSMWDVVVTRWNADRFEIDTIGRTSMSLAEAAAELSRRATGCRQ